MTHVSFADAVEERLRTRWPNRMVYRDLCRIDHETPSFFLQLVEAEPTAVNAALVRWTVKVVVAAFDVVDDYADTPTGPLLETQLAIMDLFAAGHVTADGSTAAVSANGAGRDEEAAFVELSATWLAPRRVAPPPMPEPMEHLSWKASLHIAVGQGGHYYLQTSAEAFEDI